MSTPTAELGSSEKDVAPKRNQFMSEDERRITGGGRSVTPPEDSYSTLTKLLDRPRHDPGEIRIPIPGSNRATNVSSKGVWIGTPIFYVKTKQFRVYRVVLSQ